MSGDGGDSAWLSPALQGAWYLGMAFLVCTAFSTFFFFPPPPGEFKLQLIAVLPEGGHVDALSFR